MDISIGQRWLSSSTGKDTDFVLSLEDLFPQVLLLIIYFLKTYKITTNTYDSLPDLAEVRQNESRSDSRGKTWTQDISHLCLRSS